jgi:hypothetical protein
MSSQLTRGIHSQRATPPLATSEFEGNTNSTQRGWVELN